MDLHYKNLNLEDIDNEIWIDCYGFDGVYHVSNLGRIKSLGRWVSNGKSERWVKEKIISQAKSKDGRLSCMFSISNKRYSINIQGIVWQSFNYNQELNYKKNCVMHKNKIIYDNRLDNLEYTTISKSHSVNNDYGLISHLHKYNKQRTLNYLKLKNKTCIVCLSKKEIKKFEYGRNTCFKCRGKQRKNN